MDAADTVLLSLSLTLRFSFALLLGAAAIHKLRDLARFRATLAEYDVLPSGLVDGAAPILAILEATLAALLVAGVAVPAAASAVTALMLAYGAAIHTNVLRGRTDLDCGCMGPAARVPVSAALVLRNLALGAAAATLVVTASGRAASWPDVASALAATLALAASWQAGERLLALAPRAARLRSSSRQRHGSHR
jgi:uncharacterized membrane protein YphA (DoxX/SURF4 family)